MTNASEITCVVPTHRRPAFLRRWFRFYSGVAPGFGVMIVDSSEGEALEENRAVVKAAGGTAGVVHREIAAPFYDKIHRALGEVTTPWVTLCADDDVILPEAVRRSAAFLATHPGYVSAQGRTIKFHPRRSVFAAERLKGYSIEDDDVLTRCRRIRRNFFTNFYAVFRTEVLRELFGLAYRNTDPKAGYALGEMLLSQLSAVRGRIRVLPFLHLIIEWHRGMAGVRARGQGWTDVQSHYTRFRACLVEEMARAGVEPEDAGHYVDTEYAHYRDPKLLCRLPRRSLPEAVRYWLESTRERFEDRRHECQVRHKRLVQARDVAGAEAEWNRVRDLMRQYPDGIPG